MPAEAERAENFAEIRIHSEFSRRTENRPGLGGGGVEEKPFRGRGTRIKTDIPHELWAFASTPHDFCFCHILRNIMRLHHYQDCFSRLSRINLLSYLLLLFSRGESGGGGGGKSAAALLFSLSAWGWFPELSRLSHPSPECLRIQKILASDERAEIIRRFRFSIFFFGIPPFSAVFHPLSPPLPPRFPGLPPFF